jgi:carbohydrate ABC transporter membrane protein 1, CUT1 family (TC 3.A.1.1.-)
MPLTFLRRYSTPYLFLLPALFVLSLTVLWPALQAFYLSFTSYEYDLTQAPQWVGLKNFERLAGDRVHRVGSFHNSGKTFGLNHAHSN